MKVSILIPSFNHARFLGECLASVQAQTHEDWEALVVDDCSSDGSVDTARTFAAQDPRITVFVNEENLGTYRTQQRALERTSGDLVAVLNSDDYWEPEKLARQVELLRAHPECSFAYGRGTLVDGEGQPFRTQNQHAGWPTDPVQQPLPNLLAENRILASSVVFRRAGLRFDASLRYSGDWVALLAACRRGAAAFVDEPVCGWRQHAENAHLRSRGQVLEEIRVRRSIDDAKKSWSAMATESAERGLAQNRLHLQALLLMAGDRRGALNLANRLGPEIDRRTRLLRKLAPFLPGPVRRKRFGDERTLGLSPAELTNLAPVSFD